MRGRNTPSSWVHRRALAATVAAVLGTLGPAGCSSDDAPLDAAIAIAQDDDDFGNGPEAGESLARIAQHLDDAIADCKVEVDGTRCAALGVASGYAQVLAVRVLQCTAPGRFEARTGMLELLRAVDSIEPEADGTPEPAPLPDCT